MSRDKPGLMQDETLSQPLPMPPRARRTGRTTVLVALLTFALGAVLAGWLVWSGNLAPVLPVPAARPDAPARLADRDGGGERYVPPQPAASPEAVAETAAQPASALAAAETRLALLEDRFSRIDLQATSASGNAARAEALLIAFAARRRIEGGEPLGYVEEQLRLRFSAAQPGAVDTIIATSRKPVTLAELGGELEVLAPQITDAPRAESGWARIRRELTSLFVVRRAATPTATPQERVAHAKLLLASGKIEDAIAEVQRLPGAGDAQDWIADARRYDAARRALDLIETTAMLEPRLLRDASGQALTQPSPLVTGAVATPSTAAQ